MLLLPATIIGPLSRSISQENVAKTSSSSLGVIEMEHISDIPTIILVLLMNASFIYSEIACSRRDSRMAEEIIQELLVPIFEDTLMKMPPGCPLDSNRSMYRDNELHKQEDNPARWSCQYCGKSFMNEGFLDDHFQRRHSHTVLQLPTGVCVADYCDILRCEVADHHYKPKESCNHTLMVMLHTRCAKTVKLCVPTHLQGMKKYSFINDMRLAVCEYLTCERYEEVPIPRPSSFLRVAAVVVGISFFFSAIIFFLLVCTNVLDPEPLDEDGRSSHMEKRKKGAKHVVIRIPGGNGTIRQRHRDSSEEEDDDR